MKAFHGEYSPPLLTHPMFRTVAMQIVKSFYVVEKQIWKLTVRWWNVSPRRAPFNIGIEEKLQMSREKLREFVPLGGSK